MARELGKTWIAMKMALSESLIPSQKVLFLCASSKLADMVNKKIGSSLCVRDVRSLFQSIIENFGDYQEPLYLGLSNGLKDNTTKYDAIFVDEAQDFTEEWAEIIRRLLVNEKKSRLGVFFDDVQVFRKDSFENGFGINDLPFLLHENIRNTSNIYNWASEKTNLGTDMIANPVEGPTPITENIIEPGTLNTYF